MLEALRKHLRNLYTSFHEGVSASRQLVQNDPQGKQISTNADGPFLVVDLFWAQYPMVIGPNIAKLEVSDTASRCRAIPKSIRTIRPSCVSMMFSGLTSLWTRRAASTWLRAVKRAVPTSRTN